MDVNIRGKAGETAFAQIFPQPIAIMRNHDSQVLVPDATSTSNGKQIVTRIG
jgi:hypothetical protein